MTNTLKKLYLILDERERRRAALMFLLVLGVGLFEVVGVASIMPFIAVLANPDIVDSNRHLAAAKSLMRVESTESFLFVLGLVFFVLMIGSLALRALTTWAQLRFSQMRNYSWSSRLLEGYLLQPYEWYLNRNSSNLANTLLGEVNKVVGDALNPAIQLVTNIVLVTFLFALMVIVDPTLALSVLVVLSLAYGTIFAIVRKRLSRIGEQRRLAARARFRAIQEGFGGIKDVKVLGLERGVLGRFRGPCWTFAQSNVRHGVLAEVPGTAVQGLLFGGLLLVLLYLLRAHGDFQSAAPIAALYAFAAYRLMPALRGVYRNMSDIRYSEAALDSLYSDFETVGALTDGARSSALRSGPRIPLQKAIRLDDVKYRYPNADRNALDGVTFEIPSCTTVGLVGSTGSGKTTAVDMILALLRPSSGGLVVDGQVITDDKVRAWQRSVGYVPQQIFLADASVAANIAFGVTEDKIDLAAVERAARIANLHDFVSQELPQGYQTPVGERGIRLFGGQRQRIGIARAMYSDPDVLILDEATSALDNLTEQAVMEAVQTLGKRKTIILIAHRLSTVKHCDCIYMLERGKIVRSGTYVQLAAENSRFRAMAEIA